MQNTLGIYLGSFNPFHVGHRNVLLKAQAVFDEVIVGQGWNRDKEKPSPLFAAGFDRLLFGSRYFQYEGLATDFIREQAEAHPDSKVTLIRGIRSDHDLVAELNTLRVMKDLYPPLQCVFIACDPEFQHVSSSTIRQLLSIDPKLAQIYLPK